MSGTNLQKWLMMEYLNSVLDGHVNVSVPVTYLPVLPLHHQLLVGQLQPRQQVYVCALEQYYYKLIKSMCTFALKPLLNTWVIHIV